MAEHPLLNRIPENSLDYCTKIIEGYSVQVIITKSRATKYGDFSLSKKGWKYQITINHNLNKYQFLITYIHEVAHLYNFDKHQNKVSPHGKEWKNEYSILLKKALEANLFEEKLIPVIVKHLHNPGASSCSDPELIRELKKYDEKQDGFVFLESLEINSPFYFKNQYFVKKEKIKSRFQVLAIPQLKMMLLNGLAEVLEEKDPENLKMIELTLQRYNSFKLISEVKLGQTFLNDGIVYKKISAENKLPANILNIKNMKTYQIIKDYKVEVLS